MLELLRKRRSIRKYRDGRIDPAAIDELKEAVLRAPSSRGKRPWKFFFVQEREQLAKLSLCRERNSSFLKEAALGVVVCADETVSDVWIEDCAIAATIVHLTATSLGLGSCWIQVRNRNHNDRTTTEDYLRTLLDIGPLRVLAIISVGLPDEVKPGHPLESLDREKVIG